MPIYRLEVDLNFPGFNAVHDSDFDRTIRLSSYSPESWKPLEVELAVDELGPKQKAGDLSGFGLSIPPPIFSKKAYTALTDLLEGKGIAFPLQSSEGDYFVFRVDNKLTVDLDDPSLESESIFTVELFDKAIELGVERVFVNESFKERVQKENLKGFVFANPLVEEDSGFLKAETSIPTDLTEELLWNTDDAKLCDLISEYVIARMNKDYRSETLSRLPIGAQRIFSIQHLKQEVLNGGFHQYFWNTGGEHVSLVLDALQTIGAEKHAAVLKKAAELFKKENPSFVGYQLLETLDAFASSSMEVDFDDLTMHYVHMSREEEDVNRLAVLYARTKPRDFIEKPFK